MSVTRKPIPIDDMLTVSMQNELAGIEARIPTYEKYVQEHPDDAMQSGQLRYWYARVKVLRNRLGMEASTNPNVPV